MFDVLARLFTSSRPTLTSTTIFTPSKPSTAYAQHNAAGKTPSIYKLIKKNAGGATGGMKPPPYPAPNSMAASAGSSRYSSSYLR